MLRPNEPGLRVAVGVSRSGKTYGIKNDVLRAAHAGMPVMVIDRMREWVSVPQSLSGLTTRVDSVREGAAMVDGGARLVIVRPTDPLAAALEACRWAIDRNGIAGVCFNEAQAIAPAGRAKLPDELEAVANQWAHHQVATWADSQRIQKLHPDVTENATELRLYAMGGVRSLATVRELGTRELEDCVREAAKRLSAGQSGWHVRLGVMKLPPFELTRQA